MSPQEAAALVEEVRERVRARHARSVPEIPDFELPELEPLGRIRDRADGNTAAIGTVNPRPPGLLNDLAQAGKRMIARALGWMVRDQVDFNRAAVSYMDGNIETLVEINANLLRVAKEVALNKQVALSRLDEMSASVARLDEIDQTQRDLLKHLSEWKPAFEAKLDQAEIRFLHAVRDLESDARNREESFRGDWLELHHNYEKSLKEAGDEIQGKLWADLEKLRQEQERMIQTELRVLRRKTAAAAAAAPASAPSTSTSAGEPQRPTQPAAAAGLDYSRFEERFRGDESFVTENQRFYLPFFAGAKRVLDLGCGRGEFLALLAEKGVDVEGVDLDPEALAAAREKEIKAVHGDLFEFLAEQPDGSCDGIFSAHVIEHLPPERLQELADLAYRKLRHGGVIALETPNPGCLAIFAGDFFLDPTHERPVPSARMHFHLEEAGFGKIETHERHPAPEVFPELAALDESPALAPFRRKFFGGLDYAIIGRKL